MALGYLALVLHAHLPFVRHPEDEAALEERWLYEAISETYIPLLRIFENLVNDGVDFKLTMSLSPPLITMFSDSLLQERYLRHLVKLRELVYKELERTYHQPEIHRNAQMYQYRINECFHTFKKYNHNLVNGFKRFQDLGKLELITCGATHGYFPLHGLYRQAIRAQVATAVDIHSRHLGRPPVGLWLPECAYNPGDDEILKEYGLKYFFTDTHGILYAEKQPRYGVFAPIYCPSGVAAFGRDAESSKQVWSADEGYPGDLNYREYYRDIGYDLDYEYIKPYIHPNGIRLNTGIKYYRITARESHHKEPYVREWAMERAAQHAGNFMFNREQQIKHLAGIMDRKPLIISPYDAELFGHWWFEGPDWLDFLIRKIAYDQETIKLITPSEYLQEYPVNQVTTPCSSSWGQKGYHEVWLEGSNDWIYRHLHKAAERMTELVHTYPDAYGLYDRALKQAARELLLAQSSDWAFIIKTGTMVEYAVRRTKTHLGNFTRLYDDLKHGTVDEQWLAGLEETNNIFTDIDYRLYA